MRIWEWIQEKRWPLGTILIGILLVTGYFAAVDHFTSDASNGRCPPYRTIGAGKSSPLKPLPPPSSKEIAKAKAAARSLRRFAVQQGKSPSLESAGPIRPINVTGTQGVAMADILLAASPAIPRGLDVARFRIQVPQRFRRVDEKSSTQYLPNAKHSRPDLIENRKVVSFQFCINLANGSVAGGTYAGQVVTALPGYESGTVTVPVNVKDSDWFTKVFYVAIVLAFLLLLYSAAQAEWNAQGQRPGGTQRKSEAFKKPLRDIFGFWSTTLVAIAAVFGGTWGVYTASPGWGADHVGSFIALLGTAIAAAGLGNLLSPATKKSDGTGTTGA